MMNKNFMALLKAFLRRIVRFIYINQIQSELLIEQLKHNSLNDLNKYEHKTYSQFGEDGLIEEIFSRIGATNKYFIEIGSGSGLENNTINLLLNNWSGAWFDIDHGYQKAYSEYFKTSLDSKKLIANTAEVTAQNINELLGDLNSPVEIDLLSIDIDSNDYYLWKSLNKVNPRVVVIEYNGVYTPKSNFIPKSNNKPWKGGNFMGTGLFPLLKLGNKKGYSLVACNLNGNNAFFVRNDLCDEGKFNHINDIDKLYQPARYYLNYYAGNFPSIDEWVKPKI